MTGVAGRVEGLSLDRMRTVVDVLGDPQQAYPVIHLTGTNGKGSTARMVTALLVAHGLSVGTYTSPHLEAITERIAWNLNPIDPNAFAEVVGELAQLEPLFVEELDGDRASYFELLTAAAYSFFAQVAVDVAVVEVGMLGRFDAANVTEAAVAVVTNIGPDHADRNDADWREHVAWEKAGIITPGNPLVLGEPADDVRATFETEGGEPVWVMEQDFGCEIDRIALGGHVVDIRTPLGRYEDILIAVHGEHQMANAACAVAAVEAWFGRPLDAEVVREAFGELKLRGRFEVLHRAPLLVLDGAHNPGGAAALAATLAEEFDIAGRRRWVLGLLRGRDVDEMLDALELRAGDHVVACTPDSPRAVPAEDLASYVAKRGIEAEVIPDPGDAVTFAWNAANTAGETDLVMVTGSLYTVGAARTACRLLGLL